MNKLDRDLGMGRAISRRDFVQGVAVAAVGAGALGAAGPALARQAPPDAATYPPLRSGLRGAHPGSFENAHAMRDGKKPPPQAERTGEAYDLIVVGCGLSGLAAACYFRKQAGPKAKILILDNHDDFGGHAKRNEFVHEGRTLVTHGGSEYLVAPPLWRPEALGLLDDVGLDWRTPAAGRKPAFADAAKLGPATYFNKDFYGADKLVTGGSIQKPTADYLRKTPLNAQMQAEVLRLFTGKTDYLAGLSTEEKIAKLRSVSYRDYLLTIAKFPPEILAYTQGVWALGNDMCSAWFAFFRHRPGFEGLGLTLPVASMYSPSHVGGDFHSPAGNSDLARLMVRALIPEALPAGDWKAIEMERANYAVLDRPQNAARIRVNSTVVAAQHIGAKPALLEREGREVEVQYLNGGRLYAVTGQHVIMACNNNVIPYLCPDMPAAQKAALHQAVRACNQTTNVLFRNWEAWAKLKVGQMTCPNGFFGDIALIQDTFVGSMESHRDPSEPVLVHFGTGASSGITSNPTMYSELLRGRVPAPGTPWDDQFRACRMGLLATPFATFERHVRGMAAGALSGGGLDPARDILAITVNRWPHGFATGRNSLFESGETLSPTITAKQTFGRIAIAGTDASGQGLVQTAFSEAYRAVQDLQPHDYGFPEVI